MKIRFNVRGYIDRRSAQLHARHDALIEQEWRRKVAQNPKEIRRLTRHVTLDPIAALPAILRRQAE